MLKKATPAKSASAPETCNLIGLSVFPLEILLVIQSWETLSILRQIGVAEE